MRYNPTVDVIVVGGGLAGLTAATRCTERGLSVVVLEALNRVGGRTVTESLPDGTPLDLGAPWIVDSQERVIALAAELGLEMYLTYDTGEHIFELDAEVFRYRRGALPFDPVVADEVTRAFRVLDELSREVDLDEPGRGETARDLDRMTLAAWADDTFTTELGRRFFDLFAQGLLEVEPQSASLFDTAFYIRASGGLPTLTETGPRARRKRIAGGTQLLAQRLAARLGWRICLDQPVRRVHWADDEVVVTTPSLRLAARRLVVALPPTLADRIDYSPALPSAREQVTQRTTQGGAIKCLVVYERAWWRDDGLSGRIISDTGPTGVVYDASTPGGEPGLLVALVAGQHAIACRDLDADERRAMVLACLERYLGPSAQQIIAYTEHVCSEEDLAGVCCRIYVPTTALTERNTLLREPIGSIQWANADTAAQSCGSLEGAIASGERVADEIYQHLAAVVAADPVQRLWKWNALDWYDARVGDGNGRVQPASAVFEQVCSSDTQSDLALARALADALNAGFGDPDELNALLVRLDSALQVVSFSNRGGTYWEVLSERVT